MSGLRRVWNRYVWLRGVETENADLRRQLDALPLRAAVGGLGSEAIFTQDERARPGEQRVTGVVLHAPQRELSGERELEAGERPSADHPTGEHAGLGFDDAVEPHTFSSKIL